MDPLDSGLYPDILAAGSLISALKRTAESKNLDLGLVYSHYASGPGSLSTAEMDTSRGRVSVGLGSQSRTFFVAIQGKGFTWAEGATSQLDALVEALAAWRDGISVDDFSTEFPFLTPGRLAKAHESGNLVLAQWDWLRTAEEFAKGRALVEAAYADGRFDAYFPTLSHGALRLSSVQESTQSGWVRITPLSDGSFRVENGAFNPPEVVVSLEHALAAAYTWLSTGS